MAVEALAGEVVIGVASEEEAVGEVVEEVRKHSYNHIVWLCYAQATSILNLD